MGYRISIFLLVVSILINGFSIALWNNNQQLVAEVGALSKGISDLQKNIYPCKSVNRLSIPKLPEGTYLENNFQPCTLIIPTYYPGP